MSKEYSFTLEGADKLASMLSSVGPEAPKIVSTVLLEEANVIFNRSQVLVPVDTGALRGSGGVSAAIPVPGGVGVDIFYGGPAASYALFVHEIQHFYHNPPTQAKYLEQPFMERLPDIQKNMAARIIHLIESRSR
jgi:hypothetical protein